MTQKITYTNKLSNDRPQKKQIFLGRFAVYDLCIIWNGFMFSFQSGALEITSYKRYKRGSKIFANMKQFKKKSGAFD